MKSDDFPLESNASEGPVRACAPLESAARMNAPLHVQLPKGRLLVCGQPGRDMPCIMGIVNITPDSFFKESRKPDPLHAVEAALTMIADGAQIIDFGAESTRPGSKEIAVDEEVEIVGRG